MADRAGVGIVVVNYGSHGLLEQNLVPSAATDEVSQVVVVDNFSTADERSRVTALCEAQGWTCVALDTNVGFGTGVNHGVDHLDPHVGVMLLLNPDAVIAPEAVTLLHDRVRQHPLALVAPVVVTPTGAPWSSGSDLYLTTGDMRSWRRRPAGIDPDLIQPWLSGACLMISRELWSRVGGFDDDYFLYWEDVDFSRRALEVGAELVVEEGAHVVHDEGGTHGDPAGRRAKSGTYYYYNTRNRLLFAHKHLSAHQQRAWRRSALRAAYDILLQGGRRQFRHPGRTLLPAWRGTRDGLRAGRR